MFPFNDCFKLLNLSTTSSLDELMRRGQDELSGARQMGGFGAL